MVATTIAALSVSSQRGHADPGCQEFAPLVDCLFRDLLHGNWDVVGPGEYESALGENVRDIERSFFIIE